MTQQELFPEWRETTKTVEIEAQALRLAKTPVKRQTTNKRQIRPTVDSREKLS